MASTTPRITVQTTPAGSQLGLARMTVVGAAAALILPLVLAGPALIFQINELFIAVLFTISVSFVIGTSGVPAFGNQLFFGIGAYLVAELSTRSGVTNALVFLAAAVVAGLICGGLLSVLLHWVVCGHGTTRHPAFDLTVANSPAAT